MRFPDQKDNHHNSHDGYRSEKQAPKRPGSACEQAECSSFVSHVSDIKKTRDNGNNLEQSDAFFNYILRDLVEKQDCADNGDDPEISVFHLSPEISKLSRLI